MPETHRCPTQAGSESQARRISYDLLLVATGHLSQRFDRDLAIDLRRRRTAMADVVADRRQRPPRIHESLYTGMPERVGTWSRHDDAGLPEVVSRATGHGRMRNRRAWCQRAKEDVTRGCHRTAILKVRKNRLTNQRGERIGG